MPRLPTLILLLAAAAIPPGCSIVSGAAGSPSSDRPATVAGPWEMRWGKLPDAAAGAWASEPISSPGWNPAPAISFAAASPGPESSLWLHAKLPAWGGRDPWLFIHSVDTCLEAFIDGSRVYAFGEFGERSCGAFLGWPWHMFPLPEGFAGKLLTLRICSTTRDIGIVGSIILDSRAGSFVRIFKKDQDRIILGALYLFISLASMLLLFKSEERRTLFIFAAFTLEIGIWTIAQTEVKQIFLNAPMFWLYADLTALYLAPGTLAAYLVMLVVPLFRGAMRVVSWISLAYAFLAIPLSLSGAVSLPATIAPFNVIELISLLLMLAAVAYSAVKGSTEARIFAAGIVLLTPFVIYDALNTWRGWEPPVSHWGLFIFVCSLALILRMRFQEIHSQSIHDSLTGVANRYRFDAVIKDEWIRGIRSGKPLALMMVDIDYFKSFNDTYGHTRGDEVLKSVAATLVSRVRKGPDLVARFGGEEFVVLLPETSEAGATNVAERLKTLVEALAIPHATSAISRYVTISIGVSAMAPTEESDMAYLVESADRALYLAKQAGRNRVCSATDLDAPAKDRDGRGEAFPAR